MSQQSLSDRSSNEQHHDYEWESEEEANEGELDSLGYSLLMPAIGIVSVVIVVVLWILM